MQKIAITGNIASGKSEVEKILLNKGFVVFDTDNIVHDILTDKPDVSEAFIDYDVFEYGRLSRKKLSDLVFNNKELKQKLEQIVHPYVYDEINQIFKTYKNEDFIFISIPLLFEVGWENLFDKIIFIKSDDNIRLKRLMKRNNLSETDAKIRLNSQLPQETKSLKSDFIIENNSNTDELKIRIKQILNEL